MSYNIYNNSVISGVIRIENKEDPIFVSPTRRGCFQQLQWEAVGGTPLVEVHPAGRAHQEEKRD